MACLFTDFITQKNPLCNPKDSARFEIGFNYANIINVCVPLTVYIVGESMRATTQHT